MKRSSKFRFISLNFSWVALHPNPKGVIYFIGGAFFGTFPTIFYRYLLKALFNEGYTLIAIPYRFTFQHWSVAISLLQDRTTLKSALREEAKNRGYDTTIYEEDNQKPNSSYYWIGHSLGCKYISLLELLTAVIFNDSQKEKSFDKLFQDCISLRQRKKLEAAISNIDLEQISLENQKSILIAPAIEGIEGAVPLLRFRYFSGIKTIINSVGIKVNPSQEETFCIIQQSQLFNLTSLISFKGDTRVAARTVRWLKHNLGRRLLNEAELAGRHLSPLGWLRRDQSLAELIHTFLIDKNAS